MIVGEERDISIILSSFRSRHPSLNLSVSNEQSLWLRPSLERPKMLTVSMLTLIDNLS